MSDSQHTWVHTVETVALLSAGTLAAAAVLPGAGVPAWGLPAAQITIGTVTALSFRRSGTWHALTSLAFTMGLFYGGWTIWARSAGVVHFTVVMAMVLASVVFAPWGALTLIASRRLDERRAIEQPPETDRDTEKRAEMAAFETMLSTAGAGSGSAVKVLDLKEERSGRMVLLELPATGQITLSTLENSAASFEVVLRAQPGSVTFETGSHAGEVIMRIRERNMFPDRPLLTRDLLADTINDAFPVGIQEDGSILKLKLRDIHMMVIGTTGSGKSNFLNVLFTQLTSCVDTIVWVIDMKGGRTARPWLQAWNEGRTTDSPFDWVATTREEAALMMDAFRMVVNIRMNSGIGGSKITPSASMPQVILVCDETSIILGEGKGTLRDVGEDGTTNRKFLAWAEEIAQMGRSEAACSIWSAQRGTNDMIGSGTLKALCKLRIALGAASEADYRWVIPDANRAARDMALMADTPGIGVAAIVRHASQLSKFFWHDHIEGECSENGNDGCVESCPVYKSSIEVGRRRPRLDRLTASGLGEVYATRWERAGHLTRRTVPANVAVAEVDITRFEEILRQGGVTDEDSKLSPVQIRCLEILAARKEEGASPKLLGDRLEAEGFEFARETLQRWLRKMEAAGRIHSASYGRWKIGPKPREEAA